MSGTYVEAASRNLNKNNVWLCLKKLPHFYNECFRTTRAAETGRYRLIEEMFATKGSLTDVDLARHDANNITLDDLFTELRHKKEDLISRY